MFLDLTQPKHAHIDARLRREAILWLSTVRPDGRPHLVPVWFLWDGETIFIYSQPAAQKLRNLAVQSAVTAALESAGEGIDIAIIEGATTVADAADEPTLVPVYATKYKHYLDELGWTMESMLADYSKLIRLTPRRLITW